MSPAPLFVAARKMCELRAIVEGFGRSQFAELPTLSHRKCIQSRFAKVNSCTNSSTCPVLLLISTLQNDFMNTFCEMKLRNPHFTTKLETVRFKNKSDLYDPFEVAKSAIRQVLPAWNQSRAILRIMSTEG